MTILFDATRRVKSNRKFGRGVLPSRPSYKAPAKPSDVQWWAVECSVMTEDKHFDEMATEASYQDRLDRGICL